MKVRFILKSKDGVDAATITFEPWDPGSELPVAGDAIALPTDPPGRGCHWVTHREWGIVNGKLDEVKVIARSSHDAALDPHGCCDPSLQP